MVTRDWARLGRKVRSRRTALGYKRQADLAAAGGPAERTISSLETGKSIKEWQFDKLEIALRWASGSCETILAGGEPTEMPPSAEALTSARTRHDRLDGLDPIQRELVMASPAEIARRIALLLEGRVDAARVQEWVQEVVTLRDRYRHSFGGTDADGHDQSA